MEYEERNVLIEQLLSAKDYFLPKIDQYNQLILIEEDVKKYKRSINNFSKSKPMVFLHIFSGFLIFYFLMSIASQISFINENIHLMKILMICIFIMGVIGTPILATKNFHRSKAKKIGAIEKKIENLEDERKNILSDLNIHYKDFEHKGLIPFSYSFPVSIDILLEYITSYRANTVSEAINLYLDDVHKQNMEASQQQLLHASRQNVAVTKRAGNWAAAATVFSALNLFRD